VTEKWRTPDEEQERDIATLLANPTCGALVASGLGSGKTLVITEYLIRSGSDVVLIICPLGTRPGWTRHLKGQGFEHPVYTIENTKANAENLGRFLSGEPGAYLIGHAYFRRIDIAWMKAPKNAVVIYDEVQDISNRKSRGHKVGKYLKHTRMRIAVSGTFFGNKFENAWAATRFIWPVHEIIDRSFHRWAETWALTKHDPFASDEDTYGEVRKVVGEKRRGAFVSQLPVYIRTETKIDVREIPDTRYVQLTRAQRKMYTELEQEALTWLGEHPLVTDIPIVMRIRLRQATLGEMKFNENMEVDFDLACKSSKYDALVEFLDERPGEPVAILTDSKRFAKVVATRLETLRKAKVALWTGDTPMAKREEYVQTFGTEDGPQYLVAVIAALGAGVDGLQENCSTVVWLSRSEDGILNDQVLGRFVRRGQKNNVLSVDIVAEKTLDEGILGRLRYTKVNNQKSLTREAA
jgi:hypothetical protein